MATLALGASAAGVGIAVGATASTAGSAPTLSISAGPAGTLGIANQLDACPVVPKGSTGYVRTAVLDSNGRDVSTYDSDETDQNGNWGKISDSPATKTAHFGLAPAGFMPDSNGLDPAVGTYKVVVSCEVASPGAANKTVKSYAPASFRVTGPSPTVRLSSASINPGQVLKVSPNEPCAFDANDPYAYANVFLSKTGISDGSPLITGDSPMPLGKDGNWSAVSLTIPKTASTGTYAVYADCDRYARIGTRYRVGTVGIGGTTTGGTTTGGTTTGGTTTGGTTTGGTKPVAKTRNYYSIGDSYSSGEGNAPYDLGTDKRGGNLCHRSPVAWPRLLPIAKENHFACSGATTRNLWESGGNDTSDQSQFSRLAAAEAGLSRKGQHVDLVTLSVGGNDIGFGDIIAQCFYQLECLTAFEKTEDQTMAALQTSLAGTLNHVHELAPRAKVVLVGYPRVFPVLHRNNATCGWLDNIEQERANTLATNLDTTAKLAARRANATFVSTLDTLSGHEECARTSWVTPINPNANGRDQQQGHPTAAWQAAVANLVRKELP